MSWYCLTPSVVKKHQFLLTLSRERAELRHWLVMSGPLAKHTNLLLLADGHRKISADVWDLSQLQTNFYRVAFLFVRRSSTSQVWGVLKQYYLQPIPLTVSRRAVTSQSCLDGLSRECCTFSLTTLQSQLKAWHLTVGKQSSTEKFSGNTGILSDFLK